MPEGDTIHRLANLLRPRIAQKRVVELRLRRAEFALGAVVDAHVTGVEARGKHLLIHFGNGQSLHAHMGMTGVVHHYGLADKRRRAEQHIAFSLRLEDGEVVGYRVPRLRLLRTAAIERDPVLAKVGPDLLMPESAAENLITTAVATIRAAPDTPLGVAIMDQRIAAGVGNVIKSEVLFRQRLDPFAPVSAFSEAQLTAMYEDARVLLQRNVAHTERYGRVTRDGALSPRRPVSVYGRKDEPCFDCGSRILMRRQGDQLRSTYFCPRCQNVTLPTAKEAPTSLP